METFKKCQPNLRFHPSHNIVSTPNGVGISPLYLLSPTYWGIGADKEALVSRCENVEKLAVDSSFSASDLRADITPNLAVDS